MKKAGPEAHEKDPELEPIIIELRELAKKKPLTGEDQKRAKVLMTGLKGMGYSNIEISEMAGAWSPSSVKSYTRGAKVEDASAKVSAIKLLTELISRNMSLGRVEEALYISRSLEAKDMTIDEVSDFLNEAKDVDIKEMISFYRDVKDSNYNIAQLKEALAYKSELAGRGFDDNVIHDVVEVSKIYGKPDAVLEALKAYGGLMDIRSQVSELEKMRTGLEKVVSDQKLVVEDLEERKDAIEAILSKIDNLSGKGFTDDVLNEIAKATANYGGADGVLKAITMYTNVNDLREEVARLEAQRERAESDIEKTNVKRARLQTALKMCDALIYEHKFTTSDVNELVETAKLYGNPIEALKAINRYGDLQKIESEVAKLSNEKAELGARIKELEKQIAVLRGTAQELKSSALGLLQPLADEVGRGVKAIQEKFSDAMDDISGSWEDYSMKFGEMKANSGKLEEELRLARLINAIIKYPSEVKGISLDYALLLHEALAKLCMAKGVNPKVRPTEAIYSKYYGVNKFVEIELLDILNWAQKGIRDSIAALNEQR